MPNDSMQYAWQGLEAYVQIKVDLDSLCNRIMGVKVWILLHVLHPRHGKCRPRNDEKLSLNAQNKRVFNFIWLYKKVACIRRPQLAFYWLSLPKIYVFCTRFFGFSVYMRPNYAKILITKGLVMLPNFIKGLYS